MEKELNKSIDDIKKLTIVLLMAQGLSASLISKILGINKSTMSRMLPITEINKEISKNSG